MKTKVRKTSKCGALFVLDNTPKNVEFIEHLRSLLHMMGNYRLRLCGRASMKKRGGNKFDIP